MTEFLLVALMAGYYCYSIFLFLFVFSKRKSAIIEKRISPKYFKAYRGEELPEDLMVFQNHLNNQFQLPTVFYIAGVANLALGTVTWWTVVCALLFVVSRLFHTKIHLGSNNILLRAKVYAMGIVAILGLWGGALWSLIGRF